MKIQGFLGKYELHKIEVDIQLHMKRPSPLLTQDMRTLMIQGKDCGVIRACDMLSWGAPPQVTV